ncbi:hypothetical protein BDN67DRAFT_985009 [Paxillus ammoniavirescens]|nr:hypothetical protein BDN67DRAFT_985009 [Paxillus ammoniavirescens]
MCISSVVPVCKVTGTRQCKLAWKLTTDKNMASISTGGQKWKCPEEVLDNATLTIAKQPRVANSTACRCLSAIILSDNENNTQRDTSRNTTAVPSTNHSTVLSWNEATHQGSSNNDSKDKAEVDDEEIQTERAQDTKHNGSPTTTP